MEEEETSLQAEERKLLLDTYQMIIGSNTILLELDGNAYLYKPMNNKLTFLLRHLTDQLMIVLRKETWLPQTQYTNDIVLIDGIIDVMHRINLSVKLQYEMQTV